MFQVVGRDDKVQKLKANIPTTPGIPYALVDGITNRLSVVRSLSMSFDKSVSMGT